MNLLQTLQPLYYFFIKKKSSLLQNDVPYPYQWHGLYSSPIGKARPGRMTIINNQQAPQLAQLIDEPQQLAQLATDVLAAVFTRSQPYRTHLAYNESALVQQPCL